MTRVLVVALGVLLALPSPAASHVLDEYLQGTRIAVERDRVVLEIDLTPGVAVAPAIVALIDRDGDGRVAAAEIAMYGEAVLRDLVLEIDDQRYALYLTRAESPSVVELREGAGTIRLAVSTFAPVTARHDATITAGRFGDSGRHRIRYTNAHQSAIGAYLVNALVPASRAIAITGQQRDVRQHGITLDVEVAPAHAAALWLAAPGAALAALSFYRRRRAAPCQTPPPASR